MKFLNSKNGKVATAAILLATLTVSTVSLGGLGASVHAEKITQVKKQNSLIASIEEYETADENRRLYSLTESHIAENMDEGLEVDAVKPLKDFAENTYTLFELKPTGYIVYHGDSGKFVEYSSKSTSPYLGYSGVLYYGGAMEYYYQYGETLYHTLKEDTSVSLSDICYYAEYSNQVQTALTEELASENLAYITGASKTVNVAVVSDNEGISTYSSSPRINMEDFFPRLLSNSQVGYLDGGYCGYIAANMIIGYNYFAYDYGIIKDTSFVNSNNKTMNGNGLTRRLVELDGQNPNISAQNGTTATDIFEVVDKYIDEVYISQDWTVQWRVGTVDAVNTIKKGFPVALFGNLPNYLPDGGKDGKINHAVVAYGYGKYGALKSLTKYRVHYGWNYRQDTWLESPIVGTNFFLTSP